jgi:hypothetical protein
LTLEIEGLAYLYLGAAHVIATFPAPDRRAEGETRTIITSDHTASKTASKTIKIMVFKDTFPETWPQAEIDLVAKVRTRLNAPPGS